MNPSEEVVLEVFYLDPTSSECGYPICCPGDQPKFIRPQFESQAVAEIGLASQLEEFFEESEKVS